MSHQSLGKIIKKIAWGYLICLIHIDISINASTIQLIPSWVGSWMIYQALTPLSTYEKSVELLKPLQLMIIVYDFILWCQTLIGIHFDIYLVRVIFTIIDVYFNFQLLTNIATIAKMNKYPRVERMLLLRNLKVLIITITALPFNWNSLSRITFPMVFHNTNFLITLTAIIYILFSFLVEIGVVYHLFHYAKYEQQVLETL